MKHQLDVVEPGVAGDLDQGELEGQGLPDEVRVAGHLGGLLVEQRLEVVEVLLVRPLGRRGRRGQLDADAGLHEVAQCVLLGGVKDCR